MLVNDENVEDVIAETEQEIRDMAGLSPTLATVCAGRILSA